MAAEPRLVGVRPAGEVVPGLDGNLILHAAPPTTTVAKVPSSVPGSPGQVTKP